jgi:hypothetical protein
MSADLFKKEFVYRYLAAGEQRFYRFLLAYAVNKLVLLEKGTYKGPAPNLEFLEYHDRFIILYRREGEEVYLQVARLFRKAAHKIYRTMLKKNMTPPNAKFLNLV